MVPAQLAQLLGDDRGIERIRFGGRHLFQLHDPVGCHAPDITIRAQVCHLFHADHDRTDIFPDTIDFIHRVPPKTENLRKQNIFDTTLKSDSGIVEREILYTSKTCYNNDSVDSHISQGGRYHG